MAKTKVKAKAKVKKTKKVQETTKKENYIWSVGRRKRAVARVRLYEKDKKDNTIDIVVNDKPIGQYFTNPIVKLTYAEPFELTKTLDKYRVTAKVLGSGLESQLDAVLHGIARALVKADEVHRPILKANGLLKRDPRERQKRMIGHGGSARSKKQSPKR